MIRSLAIGLISAGVILSAKAQTSKSAAQLSIGVSSGYRHFTGLRDLNEQYYYTGTGTHPIKDKWSASPYLEYKLAKRQLAFRVFADVLPTSRSDNKLEMNTTDSGVRSSFTYLLNSQFRFQSYGMGIYWAPVFHKLEGRIGVGLTYNRFDARIKQLVHSQRDYLNDQGEVTRSVVYENRTYYDDPIRQYAHGLGGFLSAGAAYKLGKFSLGIQAQAHLAAFALRMPGGAKLRKSADSQYWFINAVNSPVLADMSGVSVGIDVRYMLWRGMSK